jgi:hypothetical protein
MREGYERLFGGHIACRDPAVWDERLWGRGEVGWRTVNGITRDVDCSAFRNVSGCPGIGLDLIQCKYVEGWVLQVEIAEHPASTTILGSTLDVCWNSWC